MVLDHLHETALYCGLQLGALHSHRIHSSGTPSFFTPYYPKMVFILTLLFPSRFDLTSHRSCPNSMKKQQPPALAMFLHGFVSFCSQKPSFAAGPLVTRATNLGSGSVIRNSAKKSYSKSKPGEKAAIVAIASFASFSLRLLRLVGRHH